MTKILAVEDGQGHSDRALKDGALRVRESLLSAVLGSVRDGVATIGPDRLVMLLNPAALRMTGFSETGAIGKVFSDVLRVRDLEHAKLLAKQVHEMLSGRRDVGVSLRCMLLAQNECEIPVELSVTPLCVIPGPVTGVVVVMHDVAAQMQLKRRRCRES
jgi:PAS domain S-box-containing protein